MCGGSAPGGGGKAEKWAVVGATDGGGLLWMAVAGNVVEGGNAVEGGKADDGGKALEGGKADDGGKDDDAKASNVSTGGWGVGPAEVRA